MLITHLRHGLDRLVVRREFHIRLSRRSAAVLQNDANVHRSEWSEELRNQENV